MGAIRDWTVNIKQANDLYRSYLNQAQHQYEAVLPLLEQKFGQARGETERAFAGARQSVKDSYTQDLAATEQDLARRGLGSSTVLQSARRGAEGRRQRAMTDVAAQQGAATAGLFTQEAGARAQAQQSLGEFIAQRGGAERGMEQALLDNWLAYDQAKRARKARVWRAVGMVAGGVGGYMASGGDPRGAVAGAQVGGMAGATSSGYEY